MRRAFTLIEVNLAVGVLGVGALVILGLFVFGYRESAQSREDVEAAALADQVLSPLVAAISHTNLAWTVFREGYQFPGEKCWGEYFDENTGNVTQDPDPMAQDAFSRTMAKLGAGSLKPSVGTAFPLLGDRKLRCGLVVQHEKGSSIVRLSFRATPKPNQLMSMPLFYTEVRFQGDPDR